MRGRKCNHIIGYGIYEEIVKGMRGNYIKAIRKNEPSPRYKPNIEVKYCPDCGSKIGK